MKTAFLLLLACLAPLMVVGQECAQTPTSSQPPEAQPSSAQAAQPAPRPGHPLDPNDVAILTGHAKGQAAAYTAPTVVYGPMAPYSYGSGTRFGFHHGFFFPRSRRFGAPPFFPPFGPFFFSGFAGAGH
jgi:hypothetical protein